MSLNRIKQFSRTFAFRLNIYYVSAFTLSAIALFIVAYFLMVYAVQSKDREVVEARLEQARIVYEVGDIYGLEQYVRNNSNLDRSFFVQLVSPRGRQALMSWNAEDWLEFDPEWELVEQLRDERNFLVIPKNDRIDYKVAVTRVSDGSVLVVGRIADNTQEIIRPFKRLFLTAFVPILLIGFIGGVVQSHRSLTPIRNVIGTAKSIIKTGKLDSRVPVNNTGDELDEMAQLFNAMLDKNEGLIKTMRESLDNIAHDLRTPMTRLRGTAEQSIQHSENLDDAREALADCLEESDRALKVLTTLMDVAEAEGGIMNLNCEVADVNQLLDEVCDLYEFVAEEKQIAVEKFYSGELRAKIDIPRMRQVFANLVDNAIKYTPENGAVKIRSRQVGDQFEVKIEDNGPGIEENERDKIWDRLYRGISNRKTHKGLGLGLSLVKAIVESHKGTVEVQSEAGNGSDFRVTLPMDS